MKIKGTVKERLKACVAMERAMASFYETLAARFPEESELFEALRREELSHEKVIMVADDYGIVSDSEGYSVPPGMDLIYRTVKMAEESRERFLTAAGTTIDEALRASLMFEQSAAEGFVSELLAEDGSKVDTMLGRIYLDEREHIDRIRVAMLKRGISRAS